MQNRVVSKNSWCCYFVFGFNTLAVIISKKNSFEKTKFNNTLLVCNDLFYFAPANNLFVAI
jgi:hypothetical protein